MQSEKTYTLGEWMNEWLEVYKRPGVKPQTADGYQDTFQRIAVANPDAYNKPIADISRFDLQSVLNTMQKRGYSRNTIQKAQNVLEQIFSMAHENNWTDTNPSSRLTLPLAPTKQVLPLSGDELRAVEAVCRDDRLGHLLIFLLRTGLRRAELMALKWKDYFPGSGRHGSIYIRKSKTPAGVRTVPLVAEAAEIIRAQPRTNDGFIFHGTTGTPLTEMVLRRLCARVQKEAQICRLTPHVCRHTFVTELCKRGVPAKAIAQIIGHARANYVLDIYAHLEDQQLCHAIYALEN